MPLDQLADDGCPHHDNDAERLRSMKERALPWTPEPEIPAEYQIKCPHCDGSGLDRFIDMGVELEAPCEVCKGKGAV